MCIVVDKSLYGQVVGIYFYFGAIFKTCLNQAKYHGSPEVPIKINLGKNTGLEVGCGQAYSPNFIDNDF